MAEPNRGVAELVIQGPGGQNLRQQLIEGQTIRLGRAPANGWAVEWDRSISREHADLLWQNGRLSVTCLPTAANPIRLRGQPLRSVVVESAEAFEIGQSIFFIDVKYTARSIVSTQEMQTTPEPLIRMPTPVAQPEPEEKFETQDADEAIEEHSYKASELKDVSFGDTEQIGRASCRERVWNCV